jgi:hypothetical protein
MSDSHDSDWPRHGPPVLRGLRIAGMAVLGVIGAAVFALVFGWLVMILWNWLMPEIFHLGVITYWQAFGIVILAKLFFGGIAGGHRGGRRLGRHGGPWDEHWGPGRDRWRWYGEFWKDEGRESFARYVQKRREQSEGQGRA